MMAVYSYYNKIKKRGIVATGMAALERETGIPYNIIVSWFKNKNVMENEDILIFKTEDIVKGRQRIQSGDREVPPAKREDFIEELLK